MANPVKPTKKEQWYEIQYIYKNADVNLREDMEDYQRKQELAKLDDAEDVIVKKWILSDDVYSVEEATVKTKERFLRSDLYLIYVSGDAPMHCIIPDIKKFLSEVGPYKRD
jgi:hypothetical protein